MAHSSIPTFSEAVQPPFPLIGSVWRHKATLGEYLIDGPCQMEATWEPGVLYHPAGQQGAVPIARALGEFLDGRFEPL